MTSRGIAGCSRKCSLCGCSYVKLIYPELWQNICICALRLLTNQSDTRNFIWQFCILLKQANQHSRQGMRVGDSRHTHMTCISTFSSSQCISSINEINGNKLSTILLFLNVPLYFLSTCSEQDSIQFLSLNCCLSFQHFPSHTSRHSLISTTFSRPWPLSAPLFSRCHGNGIHHPSLSAPWPRVTKGHKVAMPCLWILYNVNVKVWTHKTMMA